ncbi:MAG: ArsR/SmtB family transcription factor [Actinomycetota bacterium]
MDLDASIDRCQYEAVTVELDVLECCPPLTGERLGAGDAEVLAEAIKALADPARLRLVSLISAGPGGEACVCELVEPLGLSQPTVSHHLKVLLEAGLVSREQRGRWAFYRVNRDLLTALSGALASAEPLPAA